MLLILTTLLQGILRTLQRLQPILHPRANAPIAMPLRKTTHKQRLKVGMKHLKRGRKRRRLNPRATASIRKVAIPNTRAHLRRLATTTIHPVKRMEPLHQQPENQHRQRKSVMLRLAIHIGKGATLQLRWRVFGLAHQTAIHHARLGIAHLKRVGIHQGHQRLVGHQHIRLVQVANHIARLVNRLNRRAEVARCAHQVAVVKQGQLSPARTRIIHLTER
jgi:hypothetical protein